MDLDGEAWELFRTLCVGEHQPAMMTFLPFPDFAASARCLDLRRLQNQRTEARFVLEWLEQAGPYFDLSDYGAARMWRGFRDALALYYNAMLQEYERRGKTNGPTLQPAAVPVEAQVVMPPWMGDLRFHSSHRAVLLLKDGQHYGQFGWPEIDNAEFREYLYPHLMDDGRWGLYPQSKYKKRTIVAVAHGDRIEAAGALVAKSMERAQTAVHDDSEDEDDVALSHRLTNLKRKPRSAPSVATSPAPVDASLPVPATTTSHAALVEEYLRLTKVDLPQRAAVERFPIRFDHCFQRVALDNAFSGCWYDFLDRKKGPAIKQIDTQTLARAVAACRRMTSEGSEAVRELDAASLRWRGKQPKRLKAVH